MFKGIVATCDKAWAPSSGKLPKGFIEHGYNEAPEEIEEENAIDDVHMLRQSGKRKTSKQTGGVARLSMQIDKLCSATDNMRIATSILTPVMDPFGIPQAVKILGEMLEEIPEESDLYHFALELIANKDKQIVFLSIHPRVRVWCLKKGMKKSLKLSSLLDP
ncbi:hypothetical protein V6N11_068009 [Hibiscus sabdariffa]|uniref:Uncharacterized protein n=1 Tax=Hibiscus sabdariffa TaxID=183260 RepID=A0ABR2SSE7_9ROSI